MFAAEREKKLGKLALTLEEVLSKTGLVVLPLSEEEFWRRPKDGAWSAAEILQHLSLTVGMYLPEIERTLEAKELNSQTSYFSKLCQPVLSRLTLSLGPPNYFRLSAPRSLDPRYSSASATLSRTKQATFEYFVETHRKIIELIRNAQGRDTEGMTVKVPLFPLLKLPIDLCFLLHVMHLERHLEQLRRTLVD
jgi:hypothetical protein